MINYFSKFLNAFIIALRGTHSVIAFSSRLYIEMSQKGSGNLWKLRPNPFICPLDSCLANPLYWGLPTRKAMFRHQNIIIEYKRLWQN